MAAGITAFEVMAKIGVDNSGFKRGLEGAKGMLSGFGSVAGSAFSGLVGLASRAFSSIGNYAKNFIEDSYRTAQEFEQSMAQVAATLGKTIEEVNSEIETTMIDGEEWTGNLREFALEMSGRTKFTATEVGEALNYMALAGYNTKMSMEMLPPVLSLAAAGAMDLGRASDVVTDAQTAFGIESERTVKMVDEMAKAASTGNTSVAQLGDAFLVVGGLAKEIGSGMAVAADGTKTETDSLQELEAALVAMANAGVKGSEAGTHMRNMLLKLSAPTEEGKNKLQEIGVSALDASGNMRSLHDIFSDMNHALSTMSGGEKMEALADIFNARDITAAQALISAAGNGSWDKIATSILDAEGAAAKMEETQLNTVMGQKKLMESALDIFKIELASNINLPFAGWIKEATGLITDLTDSLKSGGFGKMIETLLEEGGQIFEKAMKTGIPKLINKIPKFITSVLPGFISGMLSIGKSVVDAFTGSRFTHNLKAAVSNSLYLIRTFFHENREDLKNTGEALWEMLADGLRNAATFIGENLIPVITGLVNFFTNPDTINSIIDVGSDIIHNLIEGMLSEESLSVLFDPDEGMAKFIATLISAIGEVASKLVDGATTIIKKLVKFFTNKDNKEKIKDGASNILVALGEAFVDVVDVIHKDIVDLMSDIMLDMAGSADYDATAADIMARLGKSLATAWAKSSFVIFRPLDKAATDFFDILADGDPATVAAYQEYLAATDYNGTEEQWFNGGREQYRARKAMSSSYSRTNDTISSAGAAGRSAYEAAMRRRAYLNYLSDPALRGYERGGVFDHESIIRVGENGEEAVVPLENNTEWIDKLAKRLGGGVTIQFGNIYVTGVQNAGREVVSQIDTALRNYQIMQQRGRGGTGWA